MLNLLMHFDALCPDTDCALAVHFRVASILDKLGGGSEEQTGKIFDFAFALHSSCTNLGEDRRRLGSEEQISKTAFFALLFARLALSLHRFRRGRQTG